MDDTQSESWSVNRRLLLKGMGQAAVIAAASGLPLQAHAAERRSATPHIGGTLPTTQSWNYGDTTGNLLSLRGEWGFKLGAYAPGDETRDLAETVLLPGTMSTNQKGERDSSASLDRLTNLYRYVGPAVYQRTVFIPSDWAGRQITLVLERTKDTRVWLNGTEQTAYNTRNSYGTAHEYYLTDVVAGQDNVITIEVDNTLERFEDSNHMFTQETQTNWNGIIGKIALVETPPVAIRDVRVYPNLDDHTVLVDVVVANATENPVSFPAVHITAASRNGDRGHHIPRYVGDGGSVAPRSVHTFRHTVPTGQDVLLWSEWAPNLYDLTVHIGASSYATTFGMRHFGTGGPNNRNFTINGKTTFLRGEANSAVFPLSGYPYMTKEDWTEFFTRAKALGINFFRFHSWTPPESAFAAADELGIYMQPELYAFGGTVAEHFDSFREEGELIAKYLANHPSYIGMAWGNELESAGTARQAANRLRAHLRRIDPTRLYAEGTNANFWEPSLNPGDDFWTTVRTESDDVRLSFASVDRRDGGYLEAQRPNSTFTYGSALTGHHVPIMSHEIAQYQVYPDFHSEIPRYRGTFTDEGGAQRRGVFAARNLQRYQLFAEESGIADRTRIFAMVTARISALGYKAEMETALRTPEMGGYQLLSIQDFPGQGTALVGILNSFMEEKIGGLASAEYREFNRDVSLLGKLEKFVYDTEERLAPVVTIANYSPTELTDTHIRWTLGPEEVRLTGTSVRTTKHPPLASGTFRVPSVAQGAVVDVHTLDIDLSKVTRPTKLVLRLQALSGFTGSNFYNLWVYPRTAARAEPRNVLVTRTFEAAARQRLADGGRVLLLASAQDIARSVRAGWRTDFWSNMFHIDTPSYDHPKRAGTDMLGRPFVTEESYTMGMYVDAEHPVFHEFPTEFFSDYQWHQVVKNSRALILDDLPPGLPLITENIDHINRHHRLGSMFEARVGGGSLLVSTFDLTPGSDLPEVRQLYRSVLSYVASERFTPDYARLTPDHIAGLLAPTADG